MKIAYARSRAFGGIDRSTESLIMCRLYPDEIVLLNLDGKVRRNSRIFRSKEAAYKILKELTGKDFGYNVRAWRRWLKKHQYNAKTWARAMSIVDAKDSEMEV
jgi:hypothetical protein